MIPVKAFNPHNHKIGIFSPSGCLGEFPRRFDRAKRNLARHFPQGICVAPHAENVRGDGAEMAKKRARDLEGLLLNPDVGLIMCSTGGMSALPVLDDLDLDIVLSHAKPIVGFSDATALLLGLQATTDLCLFHGPALLPTFGEAEIDEYVMRSMARVMEFHLSVQTLEPPKYESDAFVFWDRDDDDAPNMQKAKGWKTLTPGKVKGRLIGGNLDTLVCLTGTKFAPSWQGCIVFWEAAFCTVEKIERDLTALGAAGVFAQAKGMIVGRPFQIADDRGDEINVLAKSVAERYGLPSLVDVNLGHTSPICTLPLGVMTELDCTTASITFLEQGTLRFG